MRQSIFVLVFLIAGKLFANPVAIPPVISEFYLNDGDWKLELYFPWEFASFNDFSDLCLICNNDTAYFINGLYFAWDTLLVIDQNSLTSSFNINLNADQIYLAYSYYFHRLDDGILYHEPGITKWGWVTTPQSGESIVNQKFTQAFGDIFYMLMKDSTPTIGYNAFDCSTRGVFSGYVHDQFGNPVPGIRFRHCNEDFCYGTTTPTFDCFVSDEDGFFETDALFCKWHHLLLEKDDFTFMTDTIFFEPDSIYYKEYILTDVSIPLIEDKPDIQIFIAPNPFFHKTTFHISMPDYQRWNHGKISIRNMNGQIVDVISFPNAEWSGNTFTIDWYPAMARGIVMPGLYLYSLEVDDRFIDSGKLIIHNP